MGWLMDYLDIKKVFYIDSVTIGNSVAAMAAKVRNVPYMRRDIFLDNSVNADDIDPISLVEGHCFTIDRKCLI